MSQFCDTCRWLWPGFTAATPFLCHFKLHKAGVSRKKKTALPFISLNNVGFSLKDCLCPLTLSLQIWPDEVWASVTATFLSPDETEAHRRYKMLDRSDLLFQVLHAWLFKSTMAKIQTPCAVFPNELKSALMHSKTLASDDGHLGQNSRRLLPKQKTMQIIMLVHRFIWFPVQTYCHYRLLPVQLSDLIWISDSTSHTAGRGKNRESGKSLNWSCLAVLCRGGFRRQGLTLKLVGKNSHKCWGHSPGPCRHFLTRHWPSSTQIQLNINAPILTVVPSSFIVSLWHLFTRMCKSHKEEL